jgi:hypothetical protein
MVSNLNNSALSNLSTKVQDIIPLALNTDGATGADEYYYQNTNWSTYWGYFNDEDLGEMKNAFIMKSIWNVGKGYTADPETTVILDHISGWGKDTFDDILFNMDLISRLGGDSYSEIIRDEKTGLLLNLKPLDPGSIKIVVDKKGILKRYEQTNKVSGNIIKFNPDEIFHLSHNRIADQVHGISDIISLKNTILAEKESFVDTKKIMHRQARPMIVFKLGTDDSSKIAQFAAKMDQAVSKGENIYVPDDTNTFSYEVVKIDLNSMLMAWRDSIRQKFYRSLGLPLTVFGAASGTESQSKIEYLAHEQVFSKDQRFLENQIWNQLYLRIKLNSPVTLLENLQNDQRKDGQQGMEIQQSDVTARSGA